MNLAPDLAAKQPQVLLAIAEEERKALLHATAQISTALDQTNKALAGERATRDTYMERLHRVQKSLSDIVAALAGHPEDLTADDVRNALTDCIRLCNGHEPVQPEAPDLRAPATPPMKVVRPDPQPSENGLE